VETIPPSSPDRKEPNDSLLAVRDERILQRSPGEDWKAAKPARVSLRKVAYYYAGFLALFGLTIAGLWLYGADLFSILLRHARAYTPPQFLTWVSLASSLSLAVAFCVMPFSLFRIIRRRADVPFDWVVLCIAGFLFLCGLTFFLSLINIWFHGPIAIWSVVLAQLGTALLSVATLLFLRALVPAILRIPTRAEWLALHNDLLRAEAESEAKDKLLATLSHELRTPLAPLLATLTELEQQIPGSRNPAAQASIDVLRQNVHLEARLITDLLDRFEIPKTEVASEARPIATASPRPRRLLLVEDHSDTLKIFARILRHKGFEVQEARTVSEAIAASQPGDLLLSDIGLPDGDGKDLMRQLGARGIPGIAISGFGSAKDREEYRRAGFSESLVKPVDIGELMNAIGRVTGAV
jgi:CheY-like chemotaxis protein